MSTSLGRLVLDMAANAAGFERDMQRISKSAQRELNKVNRELRFAQRDLEQTRRRVTMLAGAMTAVGAIALRGAVRQFRQMSDEADRIGKLGIQLGISAEAVQELGFAAEQSGSNLEQFSKGLVQMQRNIQSANDGLATQQRAFARMGIEVEKLRGLSPDQQFELIADALSKMEDQTQRNSSALEIFGRSATNILPLISRGSAGIQELREQMRATGGVMSQEAVDAAQQFNDAINVLTKQLNAFKVTLFSDVIQTVATYADWLANTEEGQKLFADLLKQIGETAKVVGIIIGVGFTGALVKAIGAMVVAEVRVARLTQQKLALAGASRSAALGVTLFGRALSVATGPIGIAVTLLGALALGYRQVKDVAATAGISMDSFGQTAETTAETVARLTGNMNELRRSEIQRAFEGMQVQAIQARQRIIELDQELQRIRQQEQLTGFLDPAAIDVSAEIEAQRAKYLELVEALNELKTAYHSVGDAASETADGNDEAGKSAGRAAIDTTRFMRSLEDLQDQMEGGNAAAVRAFYRQADEAFRMFARGQITFQTFGRAMTLYQRQLVEFNKGMRETGKTFPFTEMSRYVDMMAQARDHMQEMLALQYEIENLAASFHPLADEMLRLGDAIQLVDEALSKGLIGNAEAGMLKIGASANAAFNAMKQGVDSASKEYQQLEKAQQIVNVALGIAAILQQGMGDPYTAIPRMVAMAAMVASLGVNAGGISGSGAQSRQETQGTGTVLGDAGAKSESIVKASEITANATSALVGINRAQLRALQALQSGISGAAGMLARGAGQADFMGVSVPETGPLPQIFADIGKALDPIGFLHGIFNSIHRWMGGSAKVTDEGIEILGGTMAELIDGTLLAAFQDIRSRRWRFGSNRNSTELAFLDDMVADQFGLIFASIADSVRAGAEALGMQSDEIQAAIDAYNVQAQRISLMDLTAAEQQAELEAFFGSIFDGLAGSVVPFIREFQRVGEGLGETLVRVATGVQVTQEAMRRLGFILDTTDPQKFAQASEGLLEMTGGIDGLIAGLSNFVDKFASDTVKFEIAQDDLTRAFDQVGLSVPMTRDAMWELMQTLDATTEEGQRQIATLLELSDAADAYYRQLETIESERERLERRLLEIQGDTVALRERELAKLDESNRALQERIWELEREAAIASERADLERRLLEIQSDTMALRELELAKLDESNRHLQERIWALEDEAELVAFMAGVQQDLLDVLSPTYGEFNRLIQTMEDQRQTAERLGASEQQMMMMRQLHQAQMNQFVASLQESIRSLSEQLFGDIGGELESTARSVSTSMTSIRDSMIRALDNVREWLDRQLLSANSSLTPQQQINEAQSQFDRAIAAALGGDVSAMSDLPRLADQLLGFGSSFFGTSTNAFAGLEAQVRAAMESVAGMTPPGADQPPTFAQTAAIEAATTATAASAFEQAQMASQLVQQIAMLSRITGDAPADIGAEFGVPIGELIEKITGDLPDLTGDALAQYFDDLVSSIDGELSVLLDMRALQNAELAALQGIEATLLRIAGQPYDGQDLGSGRSDINLGSNDVIAEALRADGMSTREELREIRAELERISDQTGQGNHDRRALLRETTVFGVALVRSGESIERAIRDARSTRRGVPA